MEMLLWLYRKPAVEHKAILVGWLTSSVMQAELFQGWSKPDLVLVKAGREEFIWQNIICCFSYMSLTDYGA